MIYQEGILLACYLILVNSTETLLREFLVSRQLAATYFLSVIGNKHSCPFLTRMIFINIHALTASLLRGRGIFLYHSEKILILANGKHKSNVCKIPITYFMRFAFFLYLVFVTVTACNPVFHQQKHTRFGHIKALKFSCEHSEEVKNTALESEAVPVLSRETKSVMLQDSVFTTDMSLAQIEAELLCKKDSLNFSKIEELANPELIDSVDTQNYVEVLKDERNSNIILSGLSLIALVLTLLNGFLPMIILFTVLLLLCLLLVLLKQRRYSKILQSVRTGEPLPERYKNPKDKIRYSKDHRRSMKILTIVATVISVLTLLVSLLLYLISIIIPTITFGWTVIPMVIIAVLLIFSIVAGINYNRGQKLRGLEADGTVVGINIWNWLMIISLAITTCLTFLYHFLSSFS